MKNEDFRYLYDRLNEPSDIDVLSKELCLDQRASDGHLHPEDGTGDHEEALQGAAQQPEDDTVLADAERPSSRLSRRYEFPPMLTGLMLFQETGRSRKQYWTMVRNPETIADPELRSRSRRSPRPT